MSTTWTIKQAQHEAEQLGQELGISQLTARILLNRGLSKNDAAAFLACSLDDLHHPLGLKDMQSAAARISTALSTGEPLTIYGDYDVDGQTAAALLYAVFTRLAAQPERINYYIPHRLEEGYGLHEAALLELSTASRLVVTVDCGITSVAEAAAAQRLGLDLVITDHHEPGAQLPEAAAVVNPKRKDCSYPFKELAGVGVAFKLASAVAEAVRGFEARSMMLEYLDLVALGTVADVVPLRDENRILVRHGLGQMRKRPGLHALLEVSGIRGQPTSMDLGFRLGPRLNAGGRLGHARRGVELLLTDDAAVAEQIAGELDQANADRQNLESHTTAEAMQCVEEAGWDRQPVIVVAGQDWHPGVIGIVASRLVDCYYRPVVVAAKGDNGLWKASARSIPAFNLYEALCQCRAAVEHFGGHSMAAGLSLREEQIPLLRAQLTAQAEQMLQPEDYIRALEAEAEVAAADLTESLVEELQQLAPFGRGNPEPLFVVEGSMVQWRPVGRERNHLRYTLKQKQTTIAGIAFRQSQLMDELKPHQEQVQCLIAPQINVWNGTREVQLFTRDIRPSTQNDTFVDQWMVDRYPWQLTPEYEQLALPPSELGICSGSGIDVVDSRGQEADPAELHGIEENEQVLFYANSPAQTLAYCKRLRIHGPDPAQVAFEHPLLTTEERTELAALLGAGRARWIVSTGTVALGQSFDHVVLLEIPLGQRHWRFLQSQASAGGQLHLRYGPSQRRRLQAALASTFPDRERLAAFYAALAACQEKRLHQEQVRAAAQQARLEPGLAFGIAVFVELNLVRSDGSDILLLPRPAAKLDLYASPRYNEGMNQRADIAALMDVCLEREFPRSRNEVKP